jgi:hypothetical protein
MRKSILIIAIILLDNVAGQAQQNNQQPQYIDRYYQRFKKTELLVGMSWQGNWRNKDNSQTRRYIELGVARSLHVYTRHAITSAGLYAAEEMYFGSRKNIYGTKVGAYAHILLVDVGAAAVYYTDFKRGNLKFRPELGMGFPNVRFVFGFNIGTIDNKAFQELSQHRAQVSVQFLLPVKKKKLLSKHISQTI